MKTTRRKNTMKNIDNTMLLLLGGQLGHYLLASRKKILDKEEGQRFQIANMQERMIKHFRKRLTRQGVPTELLRCLAFWLEVHFPQKRCFGRVVSEPGRRFPRHICHQAGESSVVVTKYVDASFSLLLPWGPLHRALTIWTE